MTELKWLTHYVSSALQLWYYHFFNLSFKDKTIYWEQVWMINSLCIHSGNKQVYLGHMYLEFVQLEVVQINFHLKCNVC